jgi:hypothetical protein
MLSVKVVVVPWEPGVPAALRRDDPEIRVADPGWGEHRGVRTGRWVFISSRERERRREGGKEKQREAERSREMQNRSASEHAGNTR